MEVDNIHGNLMASPNSMYKNYRKWFDDKYGNTKTPLRFKEWLQWAQSKGKVKNADGEAEVTAKDVLAAVKQSHNTGKKIAVFSLLLSIVGIMLNISRK